MKNKCIRRGKVAYIMVTSKGKEVAVKIDATDLPLVESFKRWNVLRGRANKNYIRCNPWGKNGRTQYRKALLLHRVIAQPKPHEEVKFINKDTFDCRRSNLLCTNHRTVMAIRGGRIGQTGQRYIFKHQRGYAVRCHSFPKDIQHGYIGNFTNLKDAIKCRNKIVAIINRRIKEAKKAQDRQRKGKL